MGSAACRALVVEDDRSISSLFRAILAREGFRVDDCRTGTQAIASIAPDRYHLIVVDLRLPETGGREVITYLKTHQLDVLKTVIVVSADASAVRGGYPEPICKFLAKPFDVEEFVSLVHACSERCDTSAATRSNTPP